MVAMRSAAVRIAESALTKQMYGFNSISEIMVKSFHLYGNLASVAGNTACVAMRATSSV